MLLVAGIGIFAVAPRSEAAIHIDEEVVSIKNGRLQRAPGVGKPGFQQNFTSNYKEKA